ncbi:hypothetical protein BHM03_00003680, partial [Ensete ventricosum]
VCRGRKTANRGLCIHGDRISTFIFSVSQPSGDIKLGWPPYATEPALVRESQGTHIPIVFFPPNSKLLCRLVTTLKDYAVNAILNAVDHLGSVSWKVNRVVSEEADEVSVAESEVSSIEQVPFGPLPSTSHA